jgi:gas vesicle protein
MSGANEQTSQREREPALGSFVLGIAVGVALGLLFAPEGGEALRGKIARRLRALRALAAEQAGDLGELLVEAASPEADDHTGTSRPRSGRRRRQPGEEDASSV